MILYKTKTSETVRVDRGNGNGNCEDCLPKANTVPFIPTDNYNPATKKYVDDLVGDISKTLDIINRKHNGSSGDNPSTDTPENPDSKIGADIDKWEYLLDEDNKTVTLWRYVSSDDTVTVCNKYAIDGIVYSTKIASADDTRFSDDSNPYMFRGNTDVKNITFEKGIDTSETLSMRHMFAFTNLQTLNIKNLDTSHVENFTDMFSCFTLKGDILDVSVLNTSNATDMSEMFAYCQCKSILVSNFNTSKVARFVAMFVGCPNLQKLDLTSFDTSSAWNEQQMSCSFMFMDSPSLTEIKVSSATWNIKPSSVPTLFSKCGVSSFTYV